MTHRWRSRPPQAAQSQSPSLQWLILLINYSSILARKRWRCTAINLHQTLYYCCNDNVTSQVLKLFYSILPAYVDNSHLHWSGLRPRRLRWGTGPRQTSDRLSLTYVVHLHISTDLRSHLTMGGWDAAAFFWWDIDFLRVRQRQQSWLQWREDTVVGLPKRSLLSKRAYFTFRQNRKCWRSVHSLRPRPSHNEKENGSWHEASGRHYVLNNKQPVFGVSLC